MTDTSVFTANQVPAGTNWQVVSQREAVGQLPNGQYVDGVEITLAVGPNQDTVTTWVSGANYSDLSIVTRNITAAYNQWAAVQALSG